MAMKLTPEHVRRVLLYDPHTGLWMWREKGKGRRPGWFAGASGNRGYLRISINYRNYLVQQLAWVWMTGEWVPEVDHQDGDKTNNRWGNLREATRTQNNLNRDKQKNNKSGFRGVSYDSRRGTWVAETKIGDRRIRKSGFKTPEAAAEAWDEMAREHHGAFYRKA